MLQRVVRRGQRGCHGLVYGISGAEPPKINVATREPRIRSGGSMFDFICKRVDTKSSAVQKYIEGFYEHGHMAAQTNPLALNRPGSSTFDTLNPSRFGLKESDSLQKCDPPLNSYRSVSDLKAFLSDTYCGSVGVEFSHIKGETERVWLYSLFEEMMGKSLHDSEKLMLASLLVKSQCFDHFLAQKFSTVKRYGGEGAESMMGFFHHLFASFSKEECTKQICIGIPHRGRLNLLVGQLRFPPEQMFRKMRGLSEFSPSIKTNGDVLSHLSASVDVETPTGSVHVMLLPNPSHLEAVDPVAMGKCRAREQSLACGDYSSSQSGYPGDQSMCVLVHGDGSVAGQGIVFECMQLMNLPHFRTGGTVHLVVNNQVAFTTPAEKGRSTPYCTDIAKAFDCPVVHVNGDDPEAVAKMAELAVRYRDAFRKDIFVDLVCYRRWGHNELDDPSFTNPLMYDVIANVPTIPDMYAQRLVDESIWSKESWNQLVQSERNHLQQCLDNMEAFEPKDNHLEKQWSGLVRAPTSVQLWETGIDMEVIKFVGGKSVEFPDDVVVHPHLAKVHVGGRRKKLEAGEALDWSTAETLALGSLLLQGFHVRFCGQDVGRGTFSHRHGMLTDRECGKPFIPLNHMSKDQQGFLELANSCLSEEAVLGFEYGMSIESPKRLCIWEAQFGDFHNGAQIIIDTFITGGEAKWLLQSGLVLLLPHGYDGAGPEHSSCRIERFLQISDSSETHGDGANVNFEFANPTTSAQYFHLLRRQMVRDYRKPLIIASPKILLRHPDAASGLHDFGPGTHFQPTLMEWFGAKEQITKVIFCSGKHHVAVRKFAQEKSISNFAIVRLELRYAGRAECPVPAVGIGQVHNQENQQILKDIFA